MSKIKLTDACNITTGKLDANAAEENGQYPYFTCAPEPLSINTYAFDDNVILLAGNNASGNFHCQRYRGKFNAYQRTYVITAKQGYDIDYIYYSLKINLQHLKKIAQGSQTKFLTKQILDRFQINDIHISEQKNITKILSYIDQKIGNNNQISAEIEAMGKIIFDYWFLQFEFPNQEGKPYKSSGGKMIWNKELKKMIPEGWDVAKFGKHVDIVRGISYSSEELGGEGVPMVNLSSFNINGTYKTEGIKTYSGTFSNEKSIEPYDLLICVTQQTAIDLIGDTDVIGKTFLLPDIFESKEVVFSMDVIKIESDDVYGKYYLDKLINTKFFHKYISGFVNGTKIKHLDIKGLLKYKCEIPEKQLLKKFNIYMERIEKKRSEIIKENQELISLRDFLLPLLMSRRVGLEE